MKISYVEVILTKYPGIEFNAIGEEYEGIEWLRQDQNHPTKEELDSLIPIVQQEFDNQEYKKQRKDEYPPLADFADAYYWASKGDDTKMNEYVAKCDAVKAKYPKPV